MQFVYSLQALIGSIHHGALRNPYQARAVNRQKIFVTEIFISAFVPQNGNSDFVFGLAARIQEASG